MKKTETKKHHFVPRTYLKNFSHKKNNDYYVNVLQKDQSYDKIFESNIINVCAENHLYTLTGNDESKLMLEDIYSNIFENQYDNLYSVLTNDSIVEISPEMKKSIVSAVITMFYRTKKWINIYSSHTDEVMNKLYQVSKQFGSDSYINSKGETINIKGNTLEELQINEKNRSRIPLIITQLKAALRLIEAKQHDNINVFKIIDENEFITSDNPVLPMNINKQRTIPFDIDNAYYLPISPKYLLSIFPREADLPVVNKIIRIIIRSDQVEGFNNLQFTSCDNFLIGSISSLQKIKKRLG